MFSENHAFNPLNVRAQWDILICFRCEYNKDLEFFSKIKWVYLFFWPVFQKYKNASFSLTPVYQILKKTDHNSYHICEKTIVLDF